MPNIDLSSNLQEITITRNGKDVGVIYFDPTDSAILSRLNDIREDIKVMHEELRDYAATEHTQDEQFDKIKELDHILRGKIDYAFDYPCSEVVFGNSFVFTSKGGVTQLEQFIDGAAKIITNAIDKETKAAQKRQAKYLDRYKK